jgi:hypothetical protein
MTVPEELVRNRSIRTGSLLSQRNRSNTTKSKSGAEMSNININYNNGNKNRPHSSKNNYVQSADQAPTMMINFTLFVWKVNSVTLLKCLLLVFFMIMLFNARLYVKLNHAEQLVIESLEMKKSAYSFPSSGANPVPDDPGFSKGMHNFKFIISSILSTLKNVNQIFL